MKICAKCGRGIIGAESINAVKDTQPIWWTQEATGRMCNGRIAWVARDAQVRMLEDRE